MTTIIKLVIALIILNALVRVGMVTFKNYQFEDAVHEALLFSPNATDADLVERIGDIAEELGVTIDASDISVRRERYETGIEMSYAEDIKLVPGVYTKRWTFRPSVSARTLAVAPNRGVK